MSKENDKQEHNNENDNSNVEKTNNDEKNKNKNVDDTQFRSNKDLTIKTNQNSELVIQVSNIEDSQGSSQESKKKWVIYIFQNKHNQDLNPSQPPRLPLPVTYKPVTRNLFVKKVLIIVLFMLIITAGFLAIVLLTDDVKFFFQACNWLYIFLPTFMLLTIANYAFMCSPCSRDIPCNYILLSFAVIAMSILAAKLTVHFETSVVLYAVIATSGVVSVCVLLACSGFDFTKLMLYMVVAAAAFSLIVFIILMVKMFTGVWMKPIFIGLLSVSTLLQAIFLVIEIQTILGTKTVGLEDEEYALGAFMIYTSIIDIFLKMLLLIGCSSN